MSILDAPVQPVLTLAQKQGMVKMQIGNAARNLRTQMIAAYNNLYATVWQNPLGLTPQQVCDALGANAADLFIKADILKTALNTSVAGTITATLPTGATVTLNQNGTVTITTA